MCDFEMPIKAFMMPQTVPNKPTKGAVAPIVASRPVPCAMPLPARASILDSSIASRSLTPSADRPSERRSSIVASSTRSATGPFRVQPDWSSRAAARKASGVPELASCSTRPPFRPDKLQALRQPDRPSHDRGESEADHDDLHDDVGVQKHRPRRQIARQRADRLSGGAVEALELTGGVAGDAGLLSTALGTAGAAEEPGAVWTAGGASDLAPPAPTPTIRRPSTRAERDLRALTAA